ncbi:HNH endonuclease family protein [Halomicroarcula sp. GCM10025710]
MYNDADLIRDDRHRLKVWPIEADQEAFTDVMSLSDPESKVTGFDGGEILHECFEFFSDQIRDWAEDGPESPADHLDALVTTMWKLLRVVVIDLESNDDAQVIFETLNARGTPLLAADLIKNYLFREATLEENDPGELHDEYWRQFDEDEWRVEVSQGRLERPKIDVFIMHWLTMQMGQQVRAKKLFPAFRKFLDRTDLSTEEILQNFDYYASIYEELTEPDQQSRQGVFLQRLDVLDTTTPFPVLLYLFGQEAVPDEQRVKAVEAIESWLMRRMLCRLTSKNYNKIFIELLEELKVADDEHIGDAVVDFLQSRDGQSDYWPTDDDLSNAMVNQQYWSRINQRRLKMVFSAIERELRDTGYSETLEITQDLEIEHILPQDWELHWSLPGEQPAEVERIERDEIKNTIGNLTILTDKLNPSISNAAWEDKREAIQDHTVLLLNRYLVDTWPEEWNEETIAERGAWLAEQASDVWLEPDAPRWS